MHSKVVAVVVAYNPAIPGLLQLLHAVRPQVMRIVVVDNSDGDDLKVFMADDELGNPDYHFVGDNIGVGAAQNIGIERAAILGASHVLLLDQDSLPEPDMVSKLLAAEQQLTHSGTRVSAVGPRYRAHGADVSSCFMQLGGLKYRQIPCHAERPGELIPVDLLISSGCLISMDSMADIGNLDASLFIDLVDTEWFLRARAKGYRAYGICDAIMNHGLGDALLKYWLGRQRTMAIHSPLRTYYIFRNAVLLCRRSYVPGRWLANNAVWLFLMLVLFPLRVSPRGEYLAMMLKGLKDGILGTAGKYNG